MKTVKERLKPFYMAPVAFLIVACLLKGCQQAGMAIIQRNPEPKKLIAIEATIASAPGSFDRVEARAHYQVENDICVPETGFAHVRHAPLHQIYLPVSKNGDTYRFTAAEDALLDGEFFKQGTCHWELIGVDFDLFQKGAHFGAFISPTGSHAESATTFYFANAWYRDGTASTFLTGFKDRSNLRDPGDSFHVDLKVVSGPAMRIPTTGN